MADDIKSEALRLADLLQDECGVDGYVHDEAAAELRRLHEEITQLRHGAAAANLCIASLVAQRDALLEALKGIVAMWDHHCYAHGDGQPTPLHAKARAAIKAVEEGK